MPTCIGGAAYWAVMTPDTPRKLEIDWLRTAGGAFAAVSSAVLLSTLGAAGTIVGAALGSVVVTVGGALYSQGLARSHQRLAQVQTAAMRKVGVAQAEVRRASRQPDGDEAADAHLAHAEARLEDVKEDLEGVVDEPSSPGWRERLVLLPWKRISLVAAGFFAAAVVAITAFELVAGESVSSITGGTEGGDGTTIGRIGGGSTEDDRVEDDKAPPDDQASPSDAPSTEPSDQPEPTSTPTGEPSTSDVPDPVPTPSETAPPADLDETPPPG